MHSQLRVCTMHHVVEVLPGIWKLDRFLYRSPRRNYELKEAECPACLQIAREAFQQQFPALYAPASPHTRKSA
jgi:hypothetical protein